MLNAHNTSTVPLIYHLTLADIKTMHALYFIRLVECANYLHM